jgi:hypothetical protein
MLVVVSFVNDGRRVLMGSRRSGYVSFMESRPALGIDGIVLKLLTNNHWGGGKSGGPQKVIDSTRTGFGFSLSCIGLLGVRAAFELKQNKTKLTNSLAVAAIMSRSW